MVYTNETIADLIAEMRRRKEMLEDAASNAPLCYSTETVQAQYEILDEFIERFEAAHKREIGDAAKLRKVLSDACYAMFNFLKMQTGGYEEMAQALDQAKAALAAASSQTTLEVNRSGEVERVQET